MMDLNKGLRLGMRRLATGVCVISTRDDTDSPYAMTASSVTSLSDEPPSLLVCVNKSAVIQPYLVKGQMMAVSILNATQQAISDRCAQKTTMAERFSEGAWVEHEIIRVPYLSTPQAIFFCEVDNDYFTYGTHSIVIGRLLEVIIGDNPIDPLIYLDGQYHQLR